MRPLTLALALLELTVFGCRHPEPRQERTVSTTEITSYSPPPAPTAAPSPASTIPTMRMEDLPDAPLVQPRRGDDRYSVIASPKSEAAEVEEAPPAAATTPTMTPEPTASPSDTGETRKPPPSAADTHPWTGAE